MLIRYRTIVKQSQIISAYAPCTNHRIKEGKNPFILDSKAPTASFKDFLSNGVRYTSPVQEFPEIAEELFKKARKML